MNSAMDQNDKDLSSSSFQQKIFDWFDRRGMLSELRSHLRHQMITAFQNSSLGNNNSTGRFSVETPISPTLQALLLLVADFLAQQEYHYTVSILVAEVPLLATFPKFSAHVSHLSDHQNSLSNKDVPRYSEKDVVEIVEALGIERNSESSHHILRLYLESVPRESLLTCVLTALPAIANGFASDQTRFQLDKHPENLTFYIEEIRLLLLRAQLDQTQMQQLEDILRRFHARTSEAARREERALCLKEAETNNQQIRAWENAARQRQRDSELELESSKRQLKAVTEQLRVQHNGLLRRLRRVQKHAEEVRIEGEKVEAAKCDNENVREQLESWSSQLHTQQIRLEENFRSLQEERQSMVTLRTEVQNASEREKAYVASLDEQKETCANLQAELEKARQELSEARSQLKANVQTKTSLVEEQCRGAEKEMVSRFTQTEIEEPSASSSSMNESVPSSSVSDLVPGSVQPGTKNGGDVQSGLGAMSLVRHLRQENAELQERNNQLQRRLEEVTEQAAVRAAETRTVIPTSVVARDPPVVRPNPPPPPPLPPSQIRKMARSCELGAGEELGHPPMRNTSSSRDHTLHLHGREWKRTAPKQLLVHVEPSDYPSSDESVSEEVLRETGRRLRHLDAESELMDRRRKELKESSLRDTGSYMFIPTASTSRIPPPSVARPYEPGNLNFRPTFFSTEKLSTSLSFNLNDSGLRYSQVTWPDRQSTSTPLHGLDSPLRRGVRSHLSLSRDRRSALAEAEPPTSTQMRLAEERSEREALQRLDTALDAIKIIRQDLNRPTEGSSDEVNSLRENKDKADQDRPTQNSAFHTSPDEKALSPNDFPRISSEPEEYTSQIKDRLIATLTASVAASGVLALKETDSEEVIQPSPVCSRRFSPVVPKLPLAPDPPPVVLDPSLSQPKLEVKAVESPIDSTLNEVPTPRSSSSLSAKQESGARENRNKSREESTRKRSSVSVERSLKQESVGDKEQELINKAVESSPQKSNDKSDRVTLLEEERKIASPVEERDFIGVIRSEANEEEAVSSLSIEANPALSVGSENVDKDDSW